ncbi:MAG: DUF5060 domain-containing protein [Anaerolineaceae bacterium]|nr:DUF5060 domain-containing protein [Anaerolineaceae bacterium]
MTARVEKWDVFEISLAAQEEGNPFLDVNLGARFSHAGQSAEVAGFYDGDGVYKVRFMPEEEGAWEFTTTSSLAALDGQRGSFQCTPPAANNHGPVRVIDECHFAYADGTPYHPVGTTCYVWNLQGDEVEERTLATLRRAQFNKMRMCVFPKRYRFNNNEPPSYPFPGEVTQVWDPALLNHLIDAPVPEYWDFSRFNPQYFQHLEQRIRDLRGLGIEADLILFHPYDFGAWGFDHMPVEVNTRFLKYLVARISSLRNVWWSFANEYDLMLGRTMADWDSYFQLVQAADPYNHLRSVHNCIGFYDHSKPWVTHCSIQDHNLKQVPAWLLKYKKPVVVDECGYEGDISMSWGDLSAEELVERFWLGFTAGGYVGHGETYVNPQEELWWSKGGDLTGESVARIAFLRTVFAGIPAPGLFPLNTVDRSTIHSLDELMHSSAHNPESKILPSGAESVEAAGHNGRQYFLFYFGTHQPAAWNFNLPEGSYRIDVLDTWNMTVETAEENASGTVNVKLPRKRYIAVRVQRNGE